MTDEKYRFLADWFDPLVGVKKKFVLSFYTSDKNIDMYDMASRRVFLRKMRVESVTLSDLFVGGVVNILSRHLFITGYADEFTAKKFSRDIESAVFIINNSGFDDLGNIITLLETNDLSLNRLKLIDRDMNSFSSSILSERLDNLFAVFELRGESARNVVRKLLNPDAPIDRPIKADLGDLSAHCIAPTTDCSIEKELSIFFPGESEIHCNTLVMRNSTCCIIKPHSVREKNVGKIIQDILDSKFRISAIEIITFNTLTATKFLEVYKGVVVEYLDMISQLVSGSCVAMEITNESSDAFTEFRSYVGPPDPEVARRVRPGTLRANYGKDKIQNAVHCTDLFEDTSLELSYIFKYVHL